ncbi:hypothetical protein HDF18_19710 [Mucilaginibacter sp. X5P1]|uniref:hypothetical protein n=1 Tax=Mucilaginibacter sp. X5P1 TaxID=2723088 RepID=UPI00161776AB|nr:hypothetical protein [Mucilaginibacter sp. X5P1]MBB6139882.1 hypothetical protein [Mucilaginibacter sp. X5P1]
MSELSVQTLINLFEHQQYLLTENFNEVKIILAANSYKEVDAQTFDASLVFINARDKVQVSVIIGDNDPIDYYSPDSVSDFLLNLTKAMAQREEEPIKVIISILKKQEAGCISIYSLNHFQSFLEGLSLHNLLSQFNEFLQNTSYILLENQVTGAEIRTASIWLVNKNNNTIPAVIDRSKIISLAQTAGHSNLFAEFQLVPDDFILESNTRSGLEDIFNRLAIIGSLAYLFDIFAVENSALQYKLNGYKSIQGAVDFSEIKADKGHQYELIYHWVYNSGNFNDKIGLARNIISLHLTPSGNITLSGSPYSSLFSAYKVYEKENIKQYISVRNSLSDQLLNFHDRANSLTESFAGNLQKSGLALISFYISVVILKVLSKDNLINVFTFDTSVFSSVILLCSFIFFWFSRWELIEQKKRFSGHYFDLRRRYLDLLDTQDIDRILNNNREFLQDMDFIKAKLRRYSCMWLTFLILLFLTTWFLFLWYRE